MYFKILFCNCWLFRSMNSNDLTTFLRFNKIKVTGTNIYRFQFKADTLKFDGLLGLFNVGLSTVPSALGKSVMR